MSMTTNKQALREEFQYMQEHYSDPADRDRQVIYIAAEALLDELEADKQQIKTLESRNRRLEGIIDAAVKLIAGDRTITVKLPADYHHADGSLNTDMVNTCAVVGAFRDALAAAGITTKGE